MGMDVRLKLKSSTQPLYQAISSFDKTEAAGKVEVQTY